MWNQESQNKFEGDGATVGNPCSVALLEVGKDRQARRNWGVGRLEEEAGVTAWQCGTAWVAWWTVPLWGLEDLRSWVSLLLPTNQLKASPAKPWELCEPAAGKVGTPQLFWCRVGSREVHLSSLWAQRWQKQCPVLARGRPRGSSPQPPLPDAQLPELALRVQGAVGLSPPPLPPPPQQVEEAGGQESRVPGPVPTEASCARHPLWSLSAPPSAGYIPQRKHLTPGIRLGDKALPRNFLVPGMGLRKPS